LSDEATLGGRHYLPAIAAALSRSPFEPVRHDSGKRGTLCVTVVTRLSGAQEKKVNRSDYRA